MWAIIRHRQTCTSASFRALPIKAKTISQLCVWPPFFGANCATFEHTHQANVNISDTKEKCRWSIRPSFDCQATELLIIIDSLDWHPSFSFMMIMTFYGISILECHFWQNCEADFFSVYRPVAHACFSSVHQCTVANWLPSSDIIGDCNDRGAIVLWTEEEEDAVIDARRSVTLMMVKCTFCDQWSLTTKLMLQMLRFARFVSFVSSLCLLLCCDDELHLGQLQLGVVMPMLANSFRC